MSVYLRWDESKHPRDAGKFAPKEGAGATTEPSGTKSEEESSKIKNVGKAIWATINAWPTIAQAVVKETGASEKVSKAAYIFSMIGDYTIPGLPVGSAAVIIASTIRNPVAPMRAARKAIDSAREHLAKKGEEVKMTEKMSSSPDRLVELATLIQNKNNPELFVQLLSIAMEQTGDLDDAMDIASRAYHDPSLKGSR